MFKNLVSKPKWPSKLFILGRQTRAISSTPAINNDQKVEESLKDSASTVIIGGGIAGTSIAYHLAKQGEKNVVLLEKTELTAGSTWHAAGLTTAYHSTVNLKQLHYYSLNMYAKIEAETGQEVGFHRPGSIRVALKPESCNEFRFHMAKAGKQSAPQRLLTPKEIKELVPIIDESKVLLGLMTAYDGHIDPYSLTQAIAKGARKFGASIVQGIEVTSLDLKENGRWAVGTTKGHMTADRVVNAAGFWAKEVGNLCGLNLPLVPIQHQYLVTSSVPEVQQLTREFPVLRLLEASCYVRQERDGILVGTYEAPDVMKLQDDWCRDGVPKNFGKELFQSDLERVMPYLEQVMDVIPAMSTANIQSIVNGPITYTPDVLPMVGPSVLPNMWLAVGFGYGIVHGGGVGKFMADWIQKEEPPYDLIECDPGRFSTWTTDEYALAKAREGYGMNNANSYPFEERFAGRPTSRVTSAYEKQKERGASMVIHAGWEHPAWFAPVGETPSYEPRFGRTNWHSAVQREWETVKQSAGVIDLSPFGKFILRGPQSRKFLDYITANRVPKEGKSVVTHLLSESGKVYAELTVTALTEDQFFIVTGSGSEIHDCRWMQELARRGKFNVEFENVSDDLGCLSVAGPKAKKLLSKIHPAFEGKFPFFTYKKVEMSGVDCTAIRLTYTGELGWEIYHSKQDTLKLYEAILRAGEDEEGFGDFGSHALNVLRLEKGFRMWSAEMNMSTTIVEAGLMPFVQMTKEDFMGKKAIEKELRAEPMKDLVMVKMDESCEFDPVGDESVWVDGKVVGNTTSGCFSYLLNQPIAYVYLPSLMSVPGTQVQVELMSQLHQATVLPRAPDFTHNERLAAKKTG